MAFFQNLFESLTGLPELSAFVVIFIFGAAVGSFLNVVIYRVPNEKSIVFPNSACPGCDSPIKPYDNIPILSWLLLRGKCRSCGDAISVRYPGVELLTALLFLAAYLAFGLSPFLPVAFIFIAVMICLIFIDAAHMILPNVITYPLLVFTLLVRAVFPLLGWERVFTDIQFAPVTWFPGIPPTGASLLGALFGALAGGGSLWLVGALWKRLRGVEAMGLGDVKMMLGVGALLGWRLSFLTIFIAAFFGAVIGVFMIARQKDKDLQAQIPFGIFLGAGSIVAILFGENLIDWYMRTFVP